MNLYLDDDPSDRRLIALLQRAGHTVVTPQQAGHPGLPDARHLIYCCQNDLTLLSRNHDDFFDLHLVVEAAGGSHRGILIIRLDNDPTRDMTPKGIVTALGRLEASGIPVARQFLIVNQWR
ncbi:MAG: hypothetical protein DWQ29_24495 [Planctomycetota bacterium]|nr:MAG: hypothetical protein DWQ29_24495 [Planctomycetota bacterium]